MGANKAGRTKRQVGLEPARRRSAAHCPITPADTYTRKNFELVDYLQKSLYRIIDDHSLGISVLK